MTQFPQPQGGNEMPRFAGRGTMMRLPAAESPSDLDVAFVGIPLDIGTSQRSGTRYRPRAIRADSVMIRPYNMATGAAPFDSLRVGDLGDVPINTYILLKSVDIIEDYYSDLNRWPLIPLTLGGDHTLTLPTGLQADVTIGVGGGKSLDTCKAVASTAGPAARHHSNHRRHLLSGGAAEYPLR